MTIATAPPPALPIAAARVDVVVPTVGRPTLNGLLWLLGHALPAGSRIVVADDRPLSEPPLALDVGDERLVVVRSGGRGPAAAATPGGGPPQRRGWRSSTTTSTCPSGGCGA